MLAKLAIRDIVLIDRIELDFDKGLSVLTGETGAGKSILLDAFALALGGRGDGGLVRHGETQGQVTAVFDLARDHAARRIAEGAEIDTDGDLILRRVQFADGRTRAFVNDQPVSVQVLRAIGATLVEIHGQHDERALIDPATHRAILDASAGLQAEARAVEAAARALREARAALNEHRARIERARKAADFLRHAVEELGRLAPRPGEEAALAERRLVMMQSEKVAQDLADALDTLAGQGSPVPTLSAALRKLERRGAQAPALVDPCVGALDAALVAIDEARGALEQAIRQAEFDPRELEQAEERLFALRAAARKYAVPADRLAELRERYAADVQAIDAGEEELGALERAVAEADAAYVAAARTLSAGRRRGAEGAAAVAARARPLHLRDRGGRGGPRSRRVRAGRVLGPDQSRHEAWTTDEGRVGRRARALHAGPEGGARRQGLGPDPRLRRDRHRRRRRGRGRHRAAPRASGASRAGHGRDPRAAGGGAGLEPFPHHQGGGGALEAGRDAGHAA